MIERKHNRVNLTVSVHLDCSSGRREVRVTDLSLGGCYVDSISGVVATEKVGLKFMLPHGRTEEIYGTVAYVHEGIGFGVTFDELTYQQRTVLEQLILLNGGRP